MKRRDLNFGERIGKIWTWHSFWFQISKFNFQSTYFSQCNVAYGFKYDLNFVYIVLIMTFLAK